MVESRSNRVFMVIVMVLFFMALVIVLANREPRFEGRAASAWFADAQHDKGSLDHYGQIFVGWDDGGVRFLSEKLVNTPPTWKHKIVLYYNAVSFRLGLRKIPVGSTLSEQRTASRLLGYFEEAAAPALADLLDSGTELNRVAAIKAMGELGPTAADELGPLLMPLLRDPSSTVQYETITTLATLEYDPATVVPLLVPYLTNQMERLRVEASYALGSYPPMPDVAMTPLVDALHDASATVRANAIRAIGKMGTEAGAALDDVLACLNDRSAIVWARTVEALPFLVESEQFVGDHDYGTKMEALLKQADLYNIMMVGRARNRLGLPNSRMREACEKMTNSKSNWQVWEAVDALAELDPPPDWAVTLLEKATRHPNGVVRARAKTAFEKNR